MEGCPYSINHCDVFFHQRSTKRCNVVEYGISNVETLNTVKDSISWFVWILTDVYAQWKIGVIDLLVYIVVYIM